MEQFEAQIRATATEGRRVKNLADLARRELGPVPGDLFAGFTGVRFRLAWAPLVETAGGPEQWASACLVCRELAARPADGPQIDCEACARRQFGKALTNHKGHHFTCELGILNFCLPLRVGDRLLALACIQALDRTSGPPDQEAGIARLGRHRFVMAARLLRILVRAAENACLAVVQASELEDGRQTVAALEREQAHLHDLIHHPVPGLQALACHHRDGDATPSLPARMLAYLAEHFCEPVTLESCARDFAMNPAYLSACFSRTFGVTFKHCLTELRMEKARELLSDPNQRVAAVAAAVGYASENRFRHAFKQATGLPPSVWRRRIAAGTATDAR